MVQWVELAPPEESRRAVAAPLLPWELDEARPQDLCSEVSSPHSGSVLSEIEGTDVKQLLENGYQMMAKAIDKVIRADKCQTGHPSFCLSRDLSLMPV